uniref:F-box domain-containing protein n=1 Tax=Schizophyllum commune (strain H4-8 / FGSC 9210) TaxID=578458 RepID=D8QCZ1_SCHCM
MNDPQPSPSLSTELEDEYDIRLCSRCEYSLEMEPNISLADVESLRTGALLEPAHVVHARELTESRISSVDEVITSLHTVHDCTDGCTVPSTSCRPLSASTYDADAQFSMSPVAQSSEKDFSPCSVGNICAVMQGVVLTELKEHKRRLLRRADVQKAYVAPIRRLPAELLSEIFYHCCLEFDDITSRGSCMPLVLGTVCKRWHGAYLRALGRTASEVGFALDIAHDTPRLWTDVSLRRSKFGAELIPPDALRTRLQLYLRNSKGLPFSSEVAFYSMSRQSPHTVAFPLLLQHADQWTVVEIRQHGFSKATEGVTFPRLHTVIGNVFGMALMKSEGLMLERAPALRRAILEDVPRDKRIPGLPYDRFEWMRLRSSALFAVKILPLCSTLATLEFLVEHGRQRTLPDSVDLSSLRHLQLKTISVSVAIMKSFRAPCLESLSIEWHTPFGLFNSGTGPAEDGEALAAFYARTRPPLREISLFNPHSQARDWVFSVTSLQALKLELGDAPFDDNCAAMLAALDDGIPRYLPHLETLHLKGMICASGTLLLQMVRARVASGLRTLHLDLRLASLRKLGESKLFDLLRQAMPAASIEGREKLLNHIAAQERSDTIDAEFDAELVRIAEWEEIQCIAASILGVAVGWRWMRPHPCARDHVAARTLPRSELADDHQIRLCCHCGNSIQIEPKISLADVESLRTGALLGPADVAHAREITEGRISSVDAVIASLQRVLIELAEHKRRLLRRVDVQKAYVAPIRHLPAELLSEIFNHCCVQFDDITSKNSCMPLILGAVCKRWHDIAHDTPHLWTDIRMSKGLYGGKHIRPDALRARLQLYLRNSKGLPFSHAVQFYNDVDSTNPHGVAFPLLLQHPDRWTSVDIRYPGFSKATKGVTFTRLHTVMGNAFGFTFIESEGRVLEHAPALRCAILQDIAEDRYVPILPWNRFERMNLRSIALFAAKILPHCSALVTLEFSPMAPRDRSNQAILPESGSAEDGDALAVFYAQTRPPLREISLSYPHFQARDWAFSITSLQVLKLDLGYSAPFDDDCATLLAATDAGVPRLLPHLVTLHLKGRLRVTAASLLQMVEARANRGLQDLHLDIHSANMDRLGEPETFDLIRQAMPAAVIEGVDALVKYIVGGS